MVHEPDYPIRGHETVQKSSLLAPISRRSRGRCARPAYHRHGFAQASVAESAITLPPVTPGAPDASHSISAGHIPRTGRDCRIGRGLRSCASRTRSNRPYRSRSGDARPGRLFCAGAVAPHPRKRIHGLRSVMAGQSATRVAVLWELPAFEFAYILHGQTGGCGNANDQGPNKDAVEQVGPVLLRDALARGMSMQDLAGFLNRSEDEVRQQAGSRCHDSISSSGDSPSKRHRRSTENKSAFSAGSPSSRAKRRASAARLRHSDLS